MRKSTMLEIQTQLLKIINEPQETIKNASFVELFQHQAESNIAYAAYLRSLSVNAADIKRWQDIPALPTDAFKSASNPSSFDSVREARKTFYTSGTTSEIKGAHHFRSTEIYETSILEGWRTLKLPELQPSTLVLTPTPEDAPHSSLAHMMETLKGSFCPAAEFILTNGTLDMDTAERKLASGEPITLLGTALAFLQLFEFLETSGKQFRLPQGSWAMETGGYKGTDKSFTKEELYELFERHLGIQEDNIWNEYSMTELSSQFYTRGIGAPHRGPAWTRIQVIHPETQQAVRAGEMGYLVVYDLANYDSCIAIMTQDLAIYHDEQSFTLIGRDPSALPRGCSRSL